MMTKLVATLLCVLSLTWTASAYAADDTVVSTARELAEQGLNEYDAGHYEQAARTLLKAYHAVRVPTLARNAARALVKQGKLVAASELYMEAKRLEPNELWHGQMQQQAQQDCEQERQALLPRIARLKISLDVVLQPLLGVVVAAHDTTVSVDGVAVPEVLIGTEQFADPGKHHVVAKRGSEVAEKDIELKEGERQQVTLRFSVSAAALPSAAPAAAPAAAAAPAPSAANQSRPPTAAAGAAAAPAAVNTTGTSAPSDGSTGASGNTQRTWGWIGVSVGAAGVALGATTGIIALALRSSLRNSGCEDYICRNRRELESKANTYNSLLPISTVGFIVGAVSAATGVTLLLSSPRRESKVTVGLLIGPGSVAVQGGF